MNRETLIKHMNNAMIMKEEIKKDRMLKLTYSDCDFDKFIDRCREILVEEWTYPIEGLEIPF